MSQRRIITCMSFILLFISCQQDTVRDVTPNSFAQSKTLTMNKSENSTLQEGEFFDNEGSYSSSPRHSSLRLFDLNKYITKGRAINGRLRAVPSQWKYESKLEYSTSYATLDQPNDKRKYEVLRLIVKWYDQKQVLREVHDYLIQNHYDAFYVKHSLSVEQYVYKQNGVLDKIVGLNEGDNIMSRTEKVYNYDSRGRLSRLDYLYKDGTRYQYDQYSYKDDGSYQIDIFEPLKYMSQDFIRKWYETHDSLGNKTGYYGVNSKGIIGYKFTSEYNKQGVLIKSTDYDAMFNITTEYHAVYDDTGKKVRVQYKDKKGVKGPYREYYYDKKGRLIKETLIHTKMNQPRLLNYTEWYYE